MRSDGEWVFEGFRLDPAGRQLWQGSTAVPLRPKLFAALQYLVEHPGRLVTREELLRAVWSRTHVDETLLRGTMRDLRAALDDDAEAPRFIETIPHQGYRFLAAVRREVGSGAHAAAGASADPQANDLIEREQERAQLGRCLARALDRQRLIVFVTGEPGIGKTALVDAFVEGLPNRHGVLVGRGQCVEQYGVGEAYLPVLEAVRQMCRGRAGKRVIATLQQHAPTWLVQLPALLTDGELDALQRKTQGAGRDRMLREMAEALEALSVEMPVALVFEDLHWSDHSTLDLLGVLARRREPARLLVLGTYRPTDLIITGHPLRALTQELHGRGLCEDVPLGFLSEQATVDYLADRFGVAREDPDFRSLARTIHRRTDGNPLFMINVADDLVGRGAIARGDGAWRVSVDTAQADARVPEGLKPLIDRQLERAPAEDQRLLEAASVAGRVFSAEAVAAALEATVDRIDEQCDQLGRRGLFIEAAAGAASGQYTFLHDVYQRALYDRLSASRRARLHKRIAEFEIQGSADQVRERAAQLAVHFERGGDPARAIEHLSQAATNALTRQAFQEAIDLLRRALDLLGLLPPSSARNASELALQMQLSTPLVMSKGYSAPEAAAAAARARELSQQMEQSPVLLPVLLGMARLHFTRAELAEAAALGKQCVALSQHAPDPLPLISDSVMAYIHYFRGELEMAVAHATRGSAVYDVARHGSIALAYGDDPGVFCAAFHGWTLWRLGYPEQARARVNVALDLARRLEIPYCQGMALEISSFVYLYARDLPNAHASLNELEALATRHGFPLILAHVLGMRGWLLTQERGDAAKATELLEASLAGCKMIGFQLATPALTAYLAEAIAAGGHAARARVVVDESLAASTRTGELLDAMYALTAKGDFCATASEDDEAAACFEQAIALARKQAAKSMELRAATRLARLRHRQGQVAEARTWLGEIYGWFTEGFDTPDLRDARALLDSLDAPAPRAKPKATRAVR